MAKKFPSELRFDLVSKDWVVIATSRARRPETFKKDSRGAVSIKKGECPFENLDSQEHPLIAFWRGKRIDGDLHSMPEKWTSVVLPNKYPAFFPSTSAQTRMEGPYQAMDGVGYHEIFLTKDHKKDIPQFSLLQTKELIDLYFARYQELANEEFVNYISIFKNKGPQAGATVAHPHSQLIATAVTDPDIQRSLTGSEEYFQSREKCVHCVMLAWDIKDKTRVVFENRHMIAVAPFASRVAFEVRIFPKDHLPYFERTTERQRESLAEALQAVMMKLYKGLKDPDYNFFLHTAPVDNNDHNHYHWHWEVLPKTSTWAGFELGTGIEISTIEPEKAAEFLRKQ